MNIILIGLRGSGKSTLGKLLAEKLNFDFIDLDTKIEETEKMKISDIVKKHGWEIFRQKEKQAVKSLKKEKIDNTTIASGGGTILDSDNTSILKKLGKIIYLHRLPEDCFKHISGWESRPSLTDEKDPLKELQNLYLERDSVYKSAADIIFERTDDFEEDAEKIIHLFGASH